uniref:hypothetical protein n=1 Tax=Microbulbifer agarilyticus TaxID=260552 RepID=UPI0002558685|nr:hypothetical protein [Microbulbifer agarilyticus]
MQIDKHSAALRQLDSAIQGFFTGEDIIACHTLAGASSMLLSDLVNLKCPGKSWDAVAQEDNGLSPKEYYAITRKTQNFLKHADKDSGAILEFNPVDFTHIVFFATLNNGELGGIKSHAVQFFQLWYIACNSELFTDQKSILEPSLQLFGQIGNQSFDSQREHGSIKWASTTS